jgi:hypothetical protein
MRRLLPHAAAAALVLWMSYFPTVATAQNRLSDKDVQNMMKNLNNDAKSFRTAFDHAVSKSTIRKTSEEKSAKAFSKDFVDQTQQLLHQFQNNKKVDSSLPLVLRSAKEIEKINTDAALGPDVDSRWTKVRSELDTISRAFDVPSS